MDKNAARRAPAAETLRRPSVAAVLSELREAWDLAIEAGVRPACHAVELYSLLQAGGSAAALRWLIASGLATHHVQGQARGHPSRDRFTAASRFVLTERGATATLSLPAFASDPTPKPRWSRFELQIGDWLVMRLTPRASNQIKILDAFQEEGWPPVIDDPLPGCPGTDRQKRLRNAIQRLNHGQVVKRLLFHANGSGDGIRWELSPARGRAVVVRPHFRKTLRLEALT